MQSPSSNIFARWAISTSHCSKYAFCRFCFRQFPWRCVRPWSADPGGTLRSLIIWIVITLAAVAVVTVGVTSLIFHYVAVDERMIANIGALVGQSADGIDVEFAVNPGRIPQNTTSTETAFFQSSRPTYLQRFRRTTVYVCLYSRLSLASECNYRAPIRALDFRRVAPRTGRLHHNF